MSQVKKGNDESFEEYVEGSAYLALTDDGNSSTPKMSLGKSIKSSKMTISDESEEEDDFSYENRNQYSDKVKSKPS